MTPSPLASEQSAMLQQIPRDRRLLVSGRESPKVRLTPLSCMNPMLLYVLGPTSDCILGTFTQRVFCSRRTHVTSRNSRMIE